MLTIGVPKLSNEAGKIRLSCSIEIGNNAKELWLEVEEPYSKYLVTDRCDGFFDCNVANCDENWRRYHLLKSYIRGINA